MPSLFIDTSYGVVIGLLDESYEWLDYRRVIHQKGSQIFHALIQEMLSDNGVAPTQLKSVFKVAGPGSYTGVRLAESFTQVLPFVDVDAYSFYHFHVPVLLGKKMDGWLAYAFKGEVFEYRAIDQKHYFHPENELNINGEYYTHDLTSFGIVENLKETGSLIHNESKQLFPIVIDQNLQHDLFYFREGVKEFRPSLDAKGRKT